MAKLLVRCRHKWYLRIPNGEVQFGIPGRSVTVWYRHKRYILKRVNWDRAVAYLDRPDPHRPF